MARQPRIEYPGAIYHVMARGDRRGRVVHDENDRYSLIETLGSRNRTVSQGWISEPLRMKSAANVRAASPARRVSWTSA